MCLLQLRYYTTNPQFLVFLQRNSGAKTNPKSQIPTNLKSPIPNGFGTWSLGFGWDLVLGYCGFAALCDNETHRNRSLGIRRRRTNFLTLIPLLPNMNPCHSLEVPAVIEHAFDNNLA